MPQAILRQSSAPSSRIRPITLDKWLTALWMLVNCRNGVSSYEVARALGITQKSAWFVLHRLRFALQTGSLTKLGGNGSSGRSG